MSERFRKAVKIIFLHEGGYVYDPDDLGGETNMGISKRSYPHIDIKKLTNETASEIYYKDFYSKLKLDKVKDDNLALHIFDMSVNAGRSAAVKIAQRILEVNDDGILGSITLKAINSNNISDRYILARKEYYIALVVRNHKLSKYLKGWTNRVNNTRYGTI
jgi:lysozyme family protein